MRSGLTISSKCWDFRSGPICQTSSQADSILIVFITMMYAVSRLKRENIIDALRDDMT